MYLFCLLVNEPITGGGGGNISGWILSGSLQYKRARDKSHDQSRIAHF